MIKRPIFSIEAFLSHYLTKTSDADFAVCMFIVQTNSHQSNIKFRLTPCQAAVRDVRPLSRRSRRAGRSCRAVVLAVRDDDEADSERRETVRRSCGCGKGAASEDIPSCQRHSKTSEDGGQEG